MGKTKTHSWNAATHLKTKEEIAAYLEAVLEDGDPNLITAALGDIACAKGMTQIARETGLGRTSLYKALSPEGNPGFATSAQGYTRIGFSVARDTNLITDKLF